MRESVRQAIILAEIAFLAILPMSCGHRQKPPKPPLVPAVFKPLQQALNKSYLELFKEAPGLEFSPSQIKQMHGYLSKAQDYCVGKFQKRDDRYGNQIDKLEKRVKSQPHMKGSKRHKLECKIQNLKALRAQTKMVEEHAIPVAYANKQAKLDLIQYWPGDLKKIQAEIKSGAYRDRQYGDVKDIGFRKIAPGQKNDIKAGEDAIKQMKKNGLMPPKLKDPKIQEYVAEVARKVAAHSDLQVPVKVTVLNSKEINAFSLPGGFVFVERGLLKAADNESELAGVLGHEIAHAADRHAHKLMKKATIAGIIYQSAQVAAMVLTGGVVGIGTYYALQYGFYGLGMALNLDLLGVSRKYEEQADILGVQYTWNAGYDPTGFIRFFDKMASKEGYVNGMSWFHTHPPFYQRMVDAEREIMFLPKKQHYIVNTQAFINMKKELKKVNAHVMKVEKGKPSLRAPEQGCKAPKKIYKSGKPIETICSKPPTTR